VAVEQRMCHAVAGLDAVFLRGTGDHFEHPLCQPA